MKIINEEYDEIVKIFNKEKMSFHQRKENLETVPFSSVGWSSSYMDIFPYDSIINNLKPATIYTKEKSPAITNHYINTEVVYAFNNENEGWGSLFVERDDKNKKSYLFIENDDEEMVLQQLKIAFLQNNKYQKVISYMLDEDADEESLTIDIFEYDANNNIIKITRHGFFEKQTNVLPIRTFEFINNEKNVKIYAKDELGKNSIIYDGKGIG